MAVAGLYGLLAYSVTQRTRDLGLRLELGAQRGDVIWLVLRHALWLLGVGTVFGLALAWLAWGTLQHLAAGVRGFDPLSAPAVALLLAVCGLLASYLPARRVASIDPVIALRSE